MATVLTNAGRKFIADKIDGTVSTKPEYVAWGTSSTTAAVTDTQLGAEASEARVQATLSKQTTSVTDDTVKAVATITAGGSKTIAEAGLLTASTSGVLVVHGDFTGIPLNANDQIAFTFTIQVQ